MRNGVITDLSLPTADLFKGRERRERCESGTVKFRSAEFEELKRWNLFQVVEVCRSWTSALNVESFQTGESGERFKNIGIGL